MKKQAKRNARQRKRKTDKQQAQDDESIYQLMLKVSELKHIPTQIEKTTKTKNEQIQQLGSAWQIIIMRLKRKQTKNTDTTQTT